jgi:hypothetical protein
MRKSEEQHMEQYRSVFELLSEIERQAEQQTECSQQQANARFETMIAENKAWLGEPNRAEV